MADIPEIGATGACNRGVRMKFPAEFKRYLADGTVQKVPHVIYVIATHTTHTWRDCTPYITCECHDGEHELDMQCRCDVCYSNTMDILYDRERDLKWKGVGQMKPYLHAQVSVRKWGG